MVGRLGSCRGFHYPGRNPLPDSDPLLAGSQAKRDDATRWHAERLTAYSSLLPKLNNVFNRLVFEYDSAPIEPEDVFDAVEPEATNARLLATPEVDKAIADVIGKLATVADRGWDSSMDHISMQAMQETSRNFAKVDPIGTRRASHE